MKLSGSFLSTPLILVLALLFVYGSAFGVDPNWAPDLILPGDTSVHLCEAESICYDIYVTDVDVNDEITLTLLDGPIAYEPKIFGPNFTETICFYPDTTGLYRFIWQLRDSYSHIVVDTVIFSVSVNIDPVIEDQYFSEQICFAPHPRILPISAYDPDCDTLRFFMLEGLGTIDKYTGILEYEADTSGVYSWLIEVLDDCTTDTARVYDTVFLNQPPLFNGEDFTVRLCEPEEICFDITAVDPEGSPVMFFLNEGPGNTTQTSDNSAQTCFMPIDVASETYMFVYCLVDDCPYEQGPSALANPSCVKDTVFVTVLIDQAPQLTCPDLLEYFTCESDTFCFDIEAYDPENSPLTYNILSGNATIEGTSVCFVGNETGEFDIVIEVVDSCGHADTCTVPISVQANQAPVITMADDFSQTLCQPETICFEALINGPELDSLLISTNYGYFDYSNNRICFDADTSGLYQIIMTATDGCGQIASDTTNITIMRNEAPTVTLVDDFSQTLCQPETICLDAEIYDYESDISSVGINYGYYDDASGQYCFAADSSGTYQIIVSVTDGCGQTASDTTLVTIIFNETPVVTLADDFSVALCQGIPICFDASFSDDTFGMVDVAPGFEFDSAMNQICFMPDSSGIYEAWLRFTDDCGLVVEDTILITVDLNYAPIFTQPLPDTTVYLCNPTMICLPFAVSDLDGDLSEVTVSHGQYDAEAGTICFVPYGGGEYQVIATATDGCGNIVADTAVVTIKTDQNVEIIVPNDTSIYLCDADTLCFPVSGIPANATVEVAGIGTWWDEANQTVCFFSDCCLENVVTVIATTECGTYNSSFTVKIETNSKPMVIVPADTSFFFCDTTEIRIPVGINDPNSNLRIVDIVGAEFDAYRSEFYLTPETSGEYTIIVTATDSCGAVDIDEIIVSVVLNTPPTLSYVLPDTAYRQCELSEIRIPISLGDVDGNGSVNTTSFGVIEYDPASGYWLVFTPDAYGELCLDLTVTDECNAVASAQICLTVEQGDFANVSCPVVNPIDLCGVELIEIPLEITGAPSSITSSFGTITDGLLSFTADTSGTYVIDVIVTSECNSDSCQVIIPINISELVEVVCPADTQVFVCGPTAIPVTYSVTGSYDNFIIDGPAILDSGNTLLVQIDSEGEHVVTLIAEGSCMSDTCSFIVSADFNEAPYITANDTSVVFCEIEQICLPIEYSDVDGNIASVSPSAGEIQDNFLCFTAPGFGEHDIVLTVTDDCGLTDSDTITVTIFEGEFVAITCPTVDPVELCEPGQICFPIDAVGTNFQLSTSLGTIADGQLCFDADTSGIYTATIIGDAGCNSDTCVVSIPVTVIDPARIVGPNDHSDIFFCSQPNLMIFPINYFGDNVQLTISPAEAWYADGFVRIDVDTAGFYEFLVIAENSCNSDTLQFSATAIFNSPPDLNASFDTTVIACELSEICIPLEVFDIDDNLFEVRATLGVVNDTIICFTPKAYGDYEIIVTAIDDCQATVVDTINLSVQEGSRALIDCPVSPQKLHITTPGEGRIPIGIMPDDAVVTVHPFGTYDAATGEIVAYFDSTGIWTFTVIADAYCNSDTCIFDVEIIEYSSPEVVCTGSVDTIMCINEPTTVCLSFTVSGTNVQVMAEPIGEIVGNTICIEVDGPGEYNVDLIAYNSTEADTCSTILVVLPGDPPQVNLPADSSVAFCVPETICLPLEIIRTDYDIVSIDAGFAQFDSQTGDVCFFADTSGLYEVIVEVVDSCGYLVSDTTLVTVDLNVPPMVQFGDDFALETCAPGQICVDFTSSNLDLANVISNIGEVNPATSQVCFMADGSGVYTIIIEAEDDCGVYTSDTINITIDENNAPIFTQPLPDTTVYLCNPTMICLPFAVSDLDGDLSEVTVSHGQYDAEAGTICFVPYGGGEYQIIATATDGCGNIVADTALVTIETDQNVEIIVPNDTSIYLCDADTICFPISGIPEGATVEVAGIGTWWDEANQTVCFFSDCCLENVVTVIATTACGSFDASFTVNIETNSKPMVIVPADSTVLLCEPEPICFPVAISDPDGNLDSVVVAGAEFDDYRDQACFTPDTSGAYTIIVTATDSCGAVDVDEITINVQFNRDPYITVDNTTSVFRQCEFSELRIPLNIADLDSNIQSAISSIGLIEYDPASGYWLVFTPDAYGELCLDLTVTDECNAVASTQVCITIIDGDYVAIDCPTIPYNTDTLCNPDQICLPLDITGDNYNVTSDYGLWEDGQLCFTADTSGTYAITVIASTDCISDTCTIIYPVKVLEPVAISCPDDQTVPLCGIDTLRYEFTISESVTSVEVSLPAYVEGNEIVIPILQEGTLPITMIANGNCKNDTCSFDITTTLNQAPAIAVIRDTAVVNCMLAEVCVPIAVSDPDNNIATVTTTHGIVSEGKDQICFTPLAYGSYDITVVVADSCGEINEQTYTLSYTEGKYASISCPEDNQFSICGPDTICIVAPVTPLDANITILPNGIYKPESGEICVWVTEGGMIPITIIAESQCATDTCEFVVEVAMGTIPVVSAPSRIDSLLCLSEPTTLCFPIEVSGTGVEISVSPVGTYANGTICVPIEEAGSIALEIIAEGTCGVDTAITNLNITADQLPELFLPESFVVERCPDDTNTICLDGIFGTDAESDVTISQVCGPGTYNQIQPDSSGICWLPEAFGLTEFCFEITDGCHTASGSFTINIVTKSDCEVCVRASIDGGASIPVGLRKTVAVNIETNDAIGGFEILLSYDASVLTFVGATKDGATTEDWEYFTYSLNNGACGMACPSGLVRFIGIADINNGANHPPDDVYNPDGTLFFVQFQIANDQNLESQFIPINFTWYDCSDNTFSDASGTLLYMDMRIYDNENRLIWDEDNDLLYPDGSRSYGMMGALDICLEGTEKGQPLRCVEFINGGIKIIPVDSIDDRGDVNLDGLSNTIADVVIFTNYFIDGLIVFTHNIPGQVAATDINADGITLSVADLVYLIRIVIGDAEPIPKVVPYSQEMTVTLASSGEGKMTVSTRAVANIGAGHIIYDIPSGMTIDKVRLADPASQMDLGYSIDGNQLRLIVYNIGSNSLPAGLNDLLEIEFSGQGILEPAHLEFADYQGRAYNALHKDLILPSEYSLSQNYPNPFNPTTNISFNLVEASEWELTVYNVLGEMVQRYEGFSAAGQIDLMFDGRNTSGQQIASGVYLYRLQAGQFSATKKMILLK